MTCRGRQIKDFFNDDIALFCLHLNCYQQIKLIQKILMNIILFNVLCCSLLSNLLGIPLMNSILEIMKRKYE